jgi:transposase
MRGLQRFEVPQGCRVLPQRGLDVGRELRRHRKPHRLGTIAKGILEASRNEEIRPVPVKTAAQQALTSLHRLRSAWVHERTARLNTVRGLLRELGVFIPVGSRQVVPAVWALLEDADSELPDALRATFAEACHEIRDIEARIQHVERHLGRISKRGDGYLRTLLIHGARSTLLHARRQQPDRLREWAHKLAQTHVHNKAAVAVANKVARIVWAVWSRLQPYGQAQRAA